MYQLEKNINPGDFFKITRPDGSIVFIDILSNVGVDGTTGIGNMFRLSTNSHNYKYILNWHNCYSFGNGVESNRVRDTFNKPFLLPGVRVSAKFEDYKEEHKKSGLIFSGIYSSAGAVNQLNQFIQAQKITKEVNPTYGSIQKLHTRDADLTVLCEDKVLKILAHKDALFNADSNAQLVANEAVLGQTIPYVGEFGISKNPESFVSEAYRSYFTDKQRGTVMRLSRDGLTPISLHGMKDYFRDSLKSASAILGGYDKKKDEYNLTLANGGSSTTVSFKENVKGWSSFKSFIPEFSLSCSGDYYTFDKGQLYTHHDETVNRNNFYGNQYNSSITTLLNDAPSVVKTFETLNYEGSQSMVQGSKTVAVTGIEHSLGSAYDGRYFFFEELEMNSLFNRSDWFATGAGSSNAEKAVKMKQYRNNVLIYSGLMMLWNTTEPGSLNSLSGGPTKGHGRRSTADGHSIGTGFGDFEVGDIITIGRHDSNFKDYFDSISKDGWYIESIVTDQENGMLHEFIEKEGKWFNYIKGTNKSVSEIDYSASNIQGISTLSQDTILEEDDGFNNMLALEEIEIYFDGSINASLQLNDIIYYIVASDLSSNATNIQEYSGEILEINRNDNFIKLAHVDITTKGPVDTTAAAPNIIFETGDYIMFAKKASVNKSGILGFYAETKFINDSVEKAELFSVGSQISESSK